MLAIKVQKEHEMNKQVAFSLFERYPNQQKTLIKMEIV
jgi:hypothetical protein